MFSVHATAAPAPASAASRVLFIDNLRWTMIVLVIAQHAMVTYSNIGHWYYNETMPYSRGTYLFFVTWESWMQAFFMGLLFFIAGFFAPAKFDRKGAGRFLRDRAFRLGLPTLIYMLLIAPAIIFLLLPPSNRPTSVPPLSQIGNGMIGPMWFCVAL